MLRVHEAEERVVGGVPHHTPGVTPRQPLLGVEHGTLGAGQVLLKVPASSPDNAWKGAQLSEGPDCTSLLEHECVTAGA